MIESPISDLKLEALEVTRDEMLRRIRDAVAYAAGEGIQVAFFGVDSTRADPAFYDAAYATAVEAGAAEVVAVDTLGVASPDAVYELVGRTRELVGPDVPIHFHGHNDFGLATANAVAAARAGARWIHGTVNGMGERAGNANLAEVALALREIALPRAETRPRRIAITSDDRIWYVDYAAGFLGRYDPASGMADEWPAPAAATSTSASAWDTGPTAS